MQIINSISVIGGGRGSLVDTAGLLPNVDRAWYVSPNARTVQALRSGNVVTDQRGVAKTLTASSLK